MRSSRGLVALFVVAAAVHLAGVLFFSAVAAGAGFAVAAGVLAVHVMKAGHVSRDVQLLQVAGLLFLITAVVNDVLDRQPDPPNVAALGEATRMHFVWLALWTVLGCGCLFAAVLRLPPDHRRGLLLSAGVVGTPTLVVVALGVLLFAFLPLEGSFTDLAVATLIGTGVVGWVTVRVKRWLGGRIPAGTIALTLGLTALILPLWTAFRSMTQALPCGECLGDTICMVPASAMRVQEPLYVADTVAAAVVLGGTLLIVLGCSGIGTWRPDDWSRDDWNAADWNSST